MFNESFDLVVVGSGGGALVAALTAAEAGLSVVVIEKQQVVGGSTSMSGGVVWMPHNPLMQAARVPDSFQAGMDYLQSVVGDPTPASTLARREAFLKSGSAMIRMLQQRGVKFVRCAGYADYYDTRKGGTAVGRSVEPLPWDGNKLGEWHDKLNPGMARFIGMAVKTNELRHLPMFLRSPKSFTVAARAFCRTKWSDLRGRDLLTNGMSLMGQMLNGVLAAGVPVWLNSPVEGLVVDNGRVAGVSVLRDGSPITIEARTGVLLDAGGFERNPEMRRRYSGDQPNDGTWTRGNIGNTGEVITAAMDIGARVDLMDEAWWNPWPRAELAASTMSQARYWPGTIFVNSHGKRFTNESNSNVEIGKAMYASDAVPCWLIFDSGFRKRYPMTAPSEVRPTAKSKAASGPPKVKVSLRRAMPGRMPKEWVDNGWIKTSDTLEGLAREIGVDAEGLVATVRRFNEDARRGEDLDFGRGESAYNRVMGDPGYKPNSALGPIDKAPFYATEFYPSDAGTCGGLVCNEYAQVLSDEDGAVIPGLYATGNMTATVMGRTYPGPGASIAYTMVFGYIAARHVAGQPGS
jgi:3-oxosteroid 1-dehydrogenase